MIAGFATAVVNNALRAAQFGRQPCRSGRKQKRPVRRGKNVCNVHVLKPAPQMPEVNRLTENCAEAGNAARPGQSAWQRWINGEKRYFDVGIASPKTKKQVGLNGLSSDIAQAGSHDADSQGLPCILG